MHKVSYHGLFGNRLPILVVVGYGVILLALLNAALTSVVLIPASVSTLVSSPTHILATSTLSGSVITSGST